MRRVLTTLLAGLGLAAGEVAHANTEARRLPCL